MDGRLAITPRDGGFTVVVPAVRGERAFALGGALLALMLVLLALSLVSLVALLTGAVVGGPACGGLFLFAVVGVWTPLTWTWLWNYGGREVLTLVDGVLTVERRVPLLRPIAFRLRLAEISQVGVAPDDDRPGAVLGRYGLLREGLGGTVRLIAAGREFRVGAGLTAEEAGRLAAALDGSRPGSA